MKRRMFSILILVIVSMYLTACEHGADIQAPLVLQPGGVEEYTGATGLWSQKELTNLYDSYVDTDLVVVACDYDLTNGQTCDFLPPGYPETPELPGQYMCSVTVPAGAVSTSGLTEAEITLAVQSYDFTVADPDASNPTTSFALGTNQVGGLQFSEPVVVTICPHPSATAAELAAARGVLYAQLVEVDGQEVVEYSDAQDVTIDEETWAFTVQVTSIPSYEDLWSKEQRGHWSEVSQTPGG